MRPALFLLLGAAVLAAAPIPAPVVIDEPTGLTAARSLSPAVVRVEATTDGALVTHHVAVGSGSRTEFTLGARDVVPGADGTPELAGDSDALRLPASTVTLDPDERATVTSVVSGPPSGSRVVAFTATPDDTGEPLIGLVIAAAPGTTSPAAPTIRTAVEPAPDRGRRLVVMLPATTAGHAAADVRVRLSPPIGPSLLDETLRDVLLWPDTERRLTWEVRLPPWPLPYRLEVVAGVPDGEVARATETVWPPGWWLSVAAASLLVLAIVVLVVRRRHRDP